MNTEQAVMVAAWSGGSILAALLVGAVALFAVWAIGLDANRQAQILNPNDDEGTPDD